jgi:hypothetical protein
MSKQTWIALLTTFLSGACGGQEAQPSGEDNDTSGDGDAPTCDSYVDEWGAPVTITVRNESTNPIYLPDTFQPSVATAAGEAIPRIVQCSNTCAGNQPGSGCDDLSINHPFVFQLRPGEEREFAWAAHTTTAKVLAVECTKEGSPTEDTPCMQVVPLPSAEYALSATAYTAVDCSYEGATVCNPCQEDSGGGCIIDVANGGGETLKATSSLSYFPNQSEDLSLQQPFEVEIVFKD